MGYVYLICDPVTDNFKIGVTRNKNNDRIKKLQTGNPTELFIRDIYETPWPFRLEKMLHKHFENQHVLNEWFKLSTNDVCEFLTTCKKLENHIKSMLDNPFFVKNLK